jgi:two-component system, NtrC family, sensor kinase
MDYGDIAMAVGITAGVIKIITNLLETEKLLPELYKYTRFAWLGMLILLVLAESSGAKFFTRNYLEIISLAVIYILYKSKGTSQNVRAIAITTLPLIFAIFVGDIFKLIVPKFYGHNHGFFDNIVTFASIWLFGFGIYVQRQNKRDKIRRQKEELERQILEEKKNKLEYQVAERTAELTQQKEALEKTVIELKTTQTQLIHAEKMASLGELTAGIAHEIQNPLNFVNNFSEMSVELIEELKSPLTPEGGILDGEKIDMELFADIIQNLEKISHHGKRASSIVKGMLEHSRTSTGVKELTDINALADEYLRLSYHGLRAKNKQFNSDFKTDFEENLPKIAVIPQDLGRVILNLINNAFYAVSSPLTPEGGTVHKKPLVEVKTQYLSDAISPFGGRGAIVISIKDNGTGMPEAVKAKIFQPFFTTKPTGEGTGLGLSLAYDIVSKGHGGTIDVQSTENEGTEFTIKLPIQSN